MEIAANRRAISATGDVESVNTKDPDAEMEDAGHDI
jgi:hypothetical protein